MMFFKQISTVVDTRSMMFFKQISTQVDAHLFIFLRAFMILFDVLCVYLSYVYK